MKIVQLCPYAMSRPGGVQRHVRDLSAWLTRQGHEVCIVAPPAPGEKPGGDELLVELGRAQRIALHGTAFEISLATPWAVRGLAKQINEWGGEILHLHTPWTPALVGQMAAALPLLPRVTTIHATLPNPSAKGPIERYIRGAATRHLTRSAAVITPSEAPLALLKDLVPGLRPMILPPTVNLAAHRPQTKVPQSALFLGRLEPRKGLDVLCAAWPQVVQTHPHAQLTIAGDGPLRQIAQSLPNATLVGSPSDGQLRELMARSELFFAPAPYGESYGLVLAEALASGAVPVAASNHGYAHVLRQLPELLVPPSDPQGLAQRAIELWQDPRRLIALRQRGVAVAQHSEVSQQGPVYEELFAQVLAARRL